ncbi:MAG: hypothetical protein HYV09_20455 [Deltaproteobacteria bacterium]|nr:hypothetical protein [Deltaproteobacteria bacterium]
MRFIFTVAVAALAAAGCTPATPYRYSAMVPAARPIPFDGRTADPGDVRVEGAVSKSTVVTNHTPELHDTAVWVPQTQVDGSATIAVSKKIEVGGRFSYASYDWARPSASGTMPFPTRPTLIGAGPEVRAAFPLDREGRFTFGLAFNFMQYRLPIAQWTKTDACGAGQTCYVDHATGSFGDGTTYRLDSQRLESKWTWALGLYPTYAFGPSGRYGHLIGHVGWHEGFQNDGFTDTTSSNGAVKSAGSITILGLGYGFRWKPLRLSAMGFAPLTSSRSPVSYLMGALITVGCDLELFG